MTTDPDPGAVQRRGGRPRLTRRPRLRGDDRTRMRQDLADGYQAGDSIRALATAHDLSFGLTRILLLEANVTLRPGHRARAKEAGGQ